MYTYNLYPYRDIERKPYIIGIFLSPMGITVSNLFSIGPKYEFHLDFHVMYLYSKFHFNTCMSCRDIEWKPLIIGIFQCPRGITMSKIFRLEVSSLLNYVIVWIPNPLKWRHFRRFVSYVGHKLTLNHWVFHIHCLHGILNTTYYSAKQT